MQPTTPVLPLSGTQSMLAGAGHSQQLAAKKLSNPRHTHQLGTLLASKGQGIVGFIPLSVRRAVNKNDAVLHQSLRPHQLVVGSIVDNINDPGLASAAFQKKSMNSNL